MLGLGNVKNVAVKIIVYASFVEKLLCYFFVKRINCAETGNLPFDTSTNLVSDFFQNEFIGGVVVKNRADFKF